MFHTYAWWQWVSSSSTIIIIPMINQLSLYCLLCPCILKLPTQFNRPYHNYTIIYIQSNHHFGRNNTMNISSKMEIYHYQLSSYLHICLGQPWSLILIHNPQSWSLIDKNLHLQIQNICVCKIPGSNFEL